MTSKLTPEKADSKRTPSNPFSIENLAGLGALSAPLVYAALFVGYRTYYAELGINPEDVGIGAAFILVRSIGFIALAVAAVALVSLIVGVLETKANPAAKTDAADQPKVDAADRETTDAAEQNGDAADRETTHAAEQKADAADRERSDAAEQKADATDPQKLDPTDPHKTWVLRRLATIQRLWRRWPAIAPTALCLLLAVLLLGYLHALQPENVPTSDLLLAWLAMLMGALATVVVPRPQITLVGVSISIVIALIVPAWLIREWAIVKADRALTSDIVKGPVVEPLTLFGVLPVLDVSTQLVNVEWICGATKRLPNVFDGKDTRAAILLGETPSSLFVRMDPPGTTPIVKLPSECAVATRNLPKPDVPPTVSGKGNGG